MSSSFSKPLISVSPDNQGASVAVTNYILLSLTLFVVVTRMITMCVLKRRPDFGDLFSILAAVGCSSEPESIARSTRIIWLLLNQSFIRFLRLSRAL